MKKYSVSVDTTSFYVKVEAKAEDEAKQKAQEGLEMGNYTCEADETYYEVGQDIVEIDK